MASNPDGIESLVNPCDAAYDPNSATVAVRKHFAAMLASRKCAATALR